MSDHAREYVLGTDEQESARLGLQHRLWSEAAHRVWEQAGVRPGLTVLDLGCGPGYATLDLAMIVCGMPSTPGLVWALDESESFLAELEKTARGRRLNVRTILHDAQKLDSAAALAPDSIDVVYARWVFCFLADPDSVVRQLARLVRKGGRVVIQDYFNYTLMTMAPRRAIHDRIVQAVATSWRARGGDPDIVSRLPAMLRRHGFAVTRLGATQRIARPGEPLWAWPDSWWRSFLPRLEGMGFITAGEREEFMREWEAAARDPDGFVMMPPVFDLIAERV